MTPRALGVLATFFALVVDQANKLWLIDVFHIAQRQPVRLAPFFDVIFAENPGISYSLLSAKTAGGRLALTLAALIAIVFLCAWLWRAQTKMTALGLGLIIGGALGNNACDRFFYGYVADFYHFHVGNFSWYVFNLADVAITVGVICLVYDMIFGDTAPESSRAAAEGRSVRG
jgi:signal peptidase II